MFEIEVEREFCAAHAIEIGGIRETTHGHNWAVRVTVSAEQLDGDGLLCDFHDLERHVDAILEPFRNGDLNRTPPFDRTNPTAELVAHHIGASLGDRIPAGIRLSRVSVTEAPGCRAIYIPTT